MESPINILITKITGTLVFRGYGDSNIEERYSKFTVEPFERFLDNYEFNPSTLHYLPNGNLCIIGDEQAYCELMIIQDWKIDHVTRNVPMMDKQNFARLFSRYRNFNVNVPKNLEHLFNDV